MKKQFAWGRLKLSAQCWGFTFLELLIAVTIIGVLTAIGTVSYVSTNKQSRDARRKSDLEQLRSALEMYRSDSATSIYVVSAGAVADSALTTLVSGAYISVIPQDPKPVTGCTNYYYKNNGSSATYCLCTCLESTTLPVSTCSQSGYNYCVKNP